MSKIGGFIVKKVLVLVTLIVCGAVIILGNLHWNQKISAQGERSTTTSEQVQVSEKKTQDDPKILSVAANLPEKLQDKIQVAVESKMPVKLVIFGASEVEDTWIDMFKKEVTATYGEGVFEITAISTGDQSTSELVNEDIYEEVNEVKPDVLLFEAPMLKDNGNVGISNTLGNLEKMFESWQATNEELVLMVQPPNPLHAAIYYPDEVQQLQRFLEANKLVYLHHWDNWPGLDDAEMKDYLTDDNKANEKGFAVWADYLIEYLIAK